MAKDFKGTTRTVQELISVLEELPADAGVRVATDELTFMPDVSFCHHEDSDLCYVILEP
jgi:hypothetical protein